MPLRAVSTVLCVLALCTPASAALPNWIQWRSELAAVLSSEAVYGPFAVARHPIVKVERIEQDLYRVSSHDVGTTADQDCTMDVKIADDPDRRPAKGRVGPRHFIVVPGKLECRPAK